MSSQFYDRNGELRMDGTLVGGGGSQPAVFARVQRASAIFDWDGSTLPFDVVTVDADGLWDAPNHQYVAQEAGWYEVSAYDNGQGDPAGVSAIATATNAALTLTAVVFGAGDNIQVAVGQHTEVTLGFWIIPPLFGHTHLGIGDAVVIQGPPNAGVPAGFTFAIRLVAAD